VIAQDNHIDGTKGQRMACGVEIKSVSKLTGRQLCSEVRKIREMRSACLQGSNMVKGIPLPGPFTPRKGVSGQNDGESMITLWFC
jgi:hypothetical protein